MARTFFPLPDVINPSNTICVKLLIPDDRWHKAAFLGAIYNLTRWYSWDRDEAKTGREVADVWQLIYDQLEQTIGLEPCEEWRPVVFRQNPEDACEVQYMDEYGDYITFFDFGLCSLFNAPQTANALIDMSQTIVVNGIYAEELIIYEDDEANYPTQTEINAQAVADRDTLLCYALRIFILTTLETIASNKEQAERNQITLSMIVGAGLALGFAPFTPLIVGSILASFTAGALIGVASVSQNELRDQNAQDEVIKHVYDSLSGDVLGRSTFANVFTPNPFTSGTIPYKMVEVLKEPFSNVGSYLAVINIMKYNLAFVDALTNDCDDIGIWTHVFDFTMSNGSWVQYSANVAGTWQNGVGWVASDRFYGGGNANSYRRTNYLKRTFASTNITNIDMVMDFTKGSPVNGSAYLQALGYGTNLNNLIFKTATSLSNSDDTLSWAGNITTTQLNATCGSSSWSNGTYTGTAIIKSITVKGTGTNPFI